MRGRVQARRPCWLGALIFGVVLAATPSAGGAEIGVGKENGAVVARTDVDGCRVSLEHNVRWRTLHYRNDCLQPLEAKLALLGELIAALTGGGALPAEIDSLFIGRLVGFPELVGDAALAAHAAPDWDEKAGRPRPNGIHGSLNGYFARLLNEKRLLRPFIEALAGSGVKDGVASVEKVLVGPPASTPVEARLIAAGVRAEARLPFDAMVWLRLRQGGETLR